MKSLSQPNGFQDLFALFVNNKNEGFVLDIGCKNPVIGNNSLLLLQNGWKGIGIDITDYSNEWKKYSDVYTFVKANATDCESIKNTMSNLPKIIDFLSLDVDENSMKSLECIDLDTFKFRCICIEHDYYIRNESLRKPQRNLLESKGYTRVIQTAAEDWYVNYDLVDSKILEVLNKIPNHHELVESETPIILEWLNLK